MSCPTESFVVVVPDGVLPINLGCGNHGFRRENVPFVHPFIKYCS
jgi:hypothetical protein